MMTIEHLAIWVKDLETMKAFYVDTFGCSHGDQYHNPTKNFRSYFLAFDSGCRLELMHKPDFQDRPDLDLFGLAHLAISVGSKEKVDEMTASLEAKGVKIVGQPRTTGDGYYESVVADPEGNLIELTV